MHEDMHEDSDQRFMAFYAEELFEMLGLRTVARFLSESKLVRFIVVRVSSIYRVQLDFTCTVSLDRLFVEQ